MKSKGLMKGLALALILLMVLVGQTLSFAASKVDRIYGANRFETAVAVSAATFEKAGAVVVANGEDFADALTGAGLAVQIGAPVLLTEKTAVVKGLEAEIDRLGASKVYLIGGTSALSEKVEKDLAARYDIKRLWGADRYDTSVSIAKEIVAMGGGSDIFIANGLNFADALSAGGALAKTKGALLLSDGKTLIDGAKERVEAAESVVVLGGEAAVSKGVADAVGATRLWGDNRYETAIAIAKTYYPDPKSGVVVDGTNFPDGFAAVGYSIRHGAPILLVEKDAIDRSVAAYATGLSHLTLIGGENALSERVSNHFASGSGEALKPTPPPPPLVVRKPTNHIASADGYAYNTNEVKQAMREGTTLNGKKVAFLTFDDGPNNTITPRILDTLKAYGIHGTFFMPAQNITKSTSDTFLREYNEGHGIAMHSFTHNYSALYPGRYGNASTILSEMKLSRQRMGAYLGDGFHTNVWRYPGGHMSWNGLAKADSALADEGVMWVDWNVMTGDAEPASRRPSSVSGQVRFLNSTLANAGSPDVAVVLMHDATTKQLTANALPQIIETLKAMGYEFGILE